MLTRTNPFFQFRRNTSGVNPHSISVPSGFNGQTARVPSGDATERLSTSSATAPPMEWIVFVRLSTCHYFGLLIVHRLVCSGR